MPASHPPLLMSAAEQQIRFASGNDGVRLAWAASGSGPPLIKAATWLSHLEYDCRAPGAPPCRVPDPHPVAQTLWRNPLADGVDRAGAVVVRHDAGERRQQHMLAAAALQVTGAHARPAQPHPHLVSVRLGARQLDQTKRSVGGAGAAFVEGGLHDGSLGASHCSMRLS